MKSQMGLWRGFTLVLSLFLTTPASVTKTGNEFTPLIGSRDLARFVGDKQYWSFQDGALASKADVRLAGPAMILTTERFGNFILKFKARGSELRVLFRASIQPPGQVLGYEVEVGGLHPGNLTSRRPIAWTPKPAAGSGMPEGPEMPFLREAAEVALVEGGSTRPAVREAEWAEYEIAALGDYIVAIVNGATTAHYRATKSLEEGMLGFRLTSQTEGKTELKDIQVKLLGKVNWPSMAPPRDLTGVAAEGWQAAPANFERVTDEAWSKDSRELVSLADDERGFRPLFDGRNLNGWQNANSFWSVTEGTIEGASHNSFLVTEKEFSDFVLKGSVRLMPAGGNSGVQVRSAVIPDGMRGYQFDMGVPWWGQLYHESTQRGILVPVSDRQRRMQSTHLEGWNHFTIICRGNHLIAKLNDEVTYDLVDYYGETRGHIGLQIHVGAPMKVDFKDLRIKELP